MVVSSSGTKHYFGINIIRHEDFTVTVLGDDKLEIFGLYFLSRTLRRKYLGPLDRLELKLFLSINSRVSWLGITESNICSLILRLFQQIAPTVTGDLCKHPSRPNKLKLQSTVTVHNNPDDSCQHSLSFLITCDAGLIADAKKLIFLSAHQISSMRSGSQFYVVSWTSHKAKRSVKSTGILENLVASESIDTSNLICVAYRKLYDIDSNLFIALDWKDLYTSLTITQQSIRWWTRENLSVIRYKCGTCCINKVVWIPGKPNFANCVTKLDSQLTSAINPMLQTARLPFDFDNAESCPSEKPLG